MLKRQKLTDWSFIQATLAACWAIQDKSESYGYWLECAELIERAIEFI